MKPEDLEALYTSTGEVFQMLRDEFGLSEYQFRLDDVDDDGVSDPLGLVAFAMRRLQALRRYADPTKEANATAVAKHLGAVFEDLRTLVLRELVTKESQLEVLGNFSAELRFAGEEVLRLVRHDEEYASPEDVMIAGSAYGV